MECKWLKCQGQRIRIAQWLVYQDTSSNIKREAMMAFLGAGAPKTKHSLSDCQFHIHERQMEGMMRPECLSTKHLIRSCVMNSMSCLVKFFFALPETKQYF
jgi:hypothetical protein